MAQQAICPACGAPVEYSGSGDTIRCGFCNTQLSVTEENGEPQFEVLSQPRPQADVLRERGENTTEEILADFTNIRSEANVPSDEPVAPSYASFGSAGTDPGVFSPGAISYEVPDDATTIPQTPPYQTGRMEPASGAGNRNRYIGIGLGVFLIVCVMCACAAGAVMMFSSGTMNF